MIRTTLQRSINEEAMVITQLPPSNPFPLLRRTRNLFFLPCSLWWLKLLSLCYPKPPLFLLNPSSFYLSRSSSLLLTPDFPAAPFSSRKTLKNFLSVVFNFPFQPSLSLVSASSRFLPLPSPPLVPIFLTFSP